MGVRPSLVRAAAVAALFAALLAVLAILAAAGSTYVVHARFADAGQLVSGDLVTVGGHKVGSVGPITIAPDGLADVQLDISNRSITPLRGTTIATIGQLSLTGVANRFVSLTPGAGGPAIPSGGVLPVTQTRGIVDLDTLLDALTPRVRASIDGLLGSGAHMLAGPTAAQLNAAAAYLNPAAGQLAVLGAQIAAQQPALSRLVAATAQVAGALAARAGDLAGAVTNTAATLREIAARRSALEDILARAPAVLAGATAVLAHTRATLAVLDPALADLPPVARGLARLLPGLLRAGAEAVPTLQAVRGLVPGAERALEALPPVERLATPAVRSLTTALRLITPDLSLLRPYVPDVVAGFFNGVGGATAGAYDANGHYLHGMVAVQGGGSSTTGILNLLTQAGGSLGPYDGERTGLLSPCPGGGNPPAPDGSNPWTTPDLLPGAPTPCQPSEDQR
jgi:phospholipid/cholesterol/gamma-HCH transport system substrate-binding protein